MSYFKPISISLSPNVEKDDLHLSLNLIIRPWLWRKGKTIKELEDKFKLPVYKQKEFLTSVEARKAGNNKKSLSQSQAHSKIKQIKSGRIDASAAALILQRYLDRRSRQKEG